MAFNQYYFFFKFSQIMYDHYNSVLLWLKTSRLTFSTIMFEETIKLCTLDSLWLSENNIQEYSKSVVNVWNTPTVGQII